MNDFRNNVYRFVTIWSTRFVWKYNLQITNNLALTKFKQTEFNRDAMMITTINCGTSVLAGFVVFSVLGSLAAQTGRAVEDVVDQGEKNSNLCVIS